MKSVVFLGPNRLEIQDTSVPQIGDDEVLIRIKAVGICGSDIDCFLGHSQEPVYPYVPGHEWSGEIVEIGDSVTHFKRGDRVVAECTEGCGFCDSCRLGLNTSFCRNPRMYGFMSGAPGAFSEFMVRKEGSLIPLPDNLSDEQGALAEPLSVVYHGIWRIAGGVQTVDDVAVFGAGPIGLFAVMVCKASGSRVLSVDPIPRRRELAKLYGADVTIDPTNGDATEAIHRLTDGRGASLVVEASGSNDANSRLMDVARHGGRVVLMGQTAGRKIPMEIGRAIFKGLTVYGSSGNPFMLPPTLEFMSRNGIDFAPMITQRFPLERADEAMLLACKRTESGKILMFPGA